MEVNGPCNSFLVFKVINRILFHRDEGWKSTHISSWKTESKSHCIFFLINDAHRREREEGWERDMEGGGGRSAGTGREGGGGWRWMGVVGLLGAVRVGRCWINVLQAWTKIAPNREWRDAQPLRESCPFFSFQYHNIKSVLEGNIYSAGYIQGQDLRSCARLKTLHD